MTLPVWVQPGHPDDSVTVQMGYGRRFDSDRLFDEPSLLQRLGLGFDTDYKTDLYRQRPIAMGMGTTSEGVGQNVAPLRAAGYNSVIPAVAIAAGGRRLHDRHHAGPRRDGRRARWCAWPTQSSTPRTPRSSRRWSR